MGALEGPGRGATRVNDATGPRALLVMGEALGNLVATTLRHGRFVTRTTTDSAECRRIIADWKPQLALIDLDRYEQFLGIVGHGPANVSVRPVERLATWYYTGPLGHLVGGLLDWLMVVRKLLWAKARGRAPEW